MQQLVDYNNSLKEELSYMKDNQVEVSNEMGEFVSEDVDRFTDLVFSPSTESKSLKLVHSIDNIHHSNIISVVPWDRNNHFLFSTDVLKEIVCSEWYEGEKATIICKESVTAPCCALTTLYNGSLLLAGCMDGMVFVYAIEQDTYRVTSLRVTF